jgi:hypothetical protein
VIRYALVCDQGHAFESWFRNAAAYDEQEARGLLNCPTCGSEKVGKDIMAPRIGRKGRADPETVTASTQLVAMPSPAEAQLRAKLKELRDHVIKNSDYVGKGFAEEARKIHFGETEHRSIHGEASPEEARALAEDGVEFHPLPTIPDDWN